MAEHVVALTEARFTGEVTAGLVGSAVQRDAARAALDPVASSWAEQDDGFEHPTLRALHAWALALPGEAAVLYAHTKGAYSQIPQNVSWRRIMTAQVVGGWRRCVAILGDGYDTAGCHWRIPERHGVASPAYAGNFWWARASYLRSLPPLADGHRFGAERWIGLAAPRAYELMP